MPLPLSADTPEPALAAMCAVPCCCTHAVSGSLMCWQHWYCVDRDTRERCWDAYKALTETRSSGPAKAGLHRKWKILADDALFQACKAEGLDVPAR